MMNSRYNPQGFTLIETLIAVLLLATAIAGPLTIASKGLTATMVAKDQFAAFYLAQDAIEQVRFLRDSACLAAIPDATGCPQSAWLSSLGPCISSDGSASCYLDSLGTHPSTPTACTGACPILRYDVTNKYFNYNNSVALTPQRYVRTIHIQHDGVSDEAIMTVTVSWSDRVGVNRVPITVRENIFRWQ